MKQSLVDSAQAELFEIQAHVKGLRASYLRAHVLVDQAREAGGNDTALEAIEGILDNDLRPAIRAVRQAEQALHTAVQSLDEAPSPRFGK